MKQNIKEKVLKEVWLTPELLKEARKVFPNEIKRTKTAIDLTLAERNKEVGKVIDVRIKAFEIMFDKPPKDQIIPETTWNFVIKFIINVLKEQKKALGIK